MVSTHLKSISRNGNLPQIGVKRKNLWNQHLVIFIIISHLWSSSQNLDENKHKNGNPHKPRVGFFNNNWTTPSPPFGAPSSDRGSPGSSRKPFWGMRCGSWTPWDLRQPIPSMEKILYLPWLPGMNIPMFTIQINYTNVGKFKYTGNFMGLVLTRIFVDDECWWINEWYMRYMSLFQT